MVSTEEVEVVKKALASAEFDNWKALYDTAVKLPKGLDLTDDSMDLVLEKMADDIARLLPDMSELVKVDLELCAEPEKLGNVSLLLALKMARSKLIVAALGEPVHVTYVVPLYGELNRVKNRTEHEAGEDFVRRKARQMAWATTGSKDGRLTYDFVYVDDGCPKMSGDLVRAIVDQEKLPFTEVVNLQDAIDKKLGPIHKHIADAKSQSRKGGAVIYGLHHASQSMREGRHIFAFTDSDLSTHLGETGLLIGPMVTDGAVMTCGSRYTNGGVYCSAFAPNTAFNLEEMSTAEEEESKWVHLSNMWSRNFFRGKLLPPFETIGALDTQCGFKAMDGSIVMDIVDKVSDYWSTVDVELILFSSIKSSGKVSFVPVVWIESAAESNFWSDGDSSVYKSYWEMNNTMLVIQRKYLEKNLFPADLPEETAKWSTLVEGMSVESYEKMIVQIGKDCKNQKALLFSYKPAPAELAALCGVALA